MPAQVPPVADERESLIAYIDQQRDAFVAATFGLTEQQIRLTPTAGTLSIGGLVKHVTTCERGWTERMAAAPHAPAPPEQSLEDQARSWGDDFRVSDDDSLESLVAALVAQGEVTREVLRRADLGAAVPVPRDAPWFPKDVEAWSVRWVAMHLVEELARHAGHADIIRESIDGATMYELVAAREGWPETPWLKPWRPSTEVTA
jgi:hypothetical protein